LCEADQDPGRAVTRQEPPGVTSRALARFALCHRPVRQLIQPGLARVAGRIAVANHRPFPSPASGTRPPRTAQVHSNRRSMMSGSLGRAPVALDNEAR